MEVYILLIEFVHICHSKDIKYLYAKDMNDDRRKI